MLALPLVGFVSLGKLLHLSEPWLHRLQKQVIIPTSLMGTQTSV